MIGDNMDRLLHILLVLALDCLCGFFITMLEDSWLIILLCLIIILLCLIIILSAYLGILMAKKKILNDHNRI